ncbi:hypothetical protein [Streptomyces sp. LBL]|uniref:hypothetical protein n=1 Tax=Streptomyces sp. LBL TaxID=2940562 RepID=UPI002473D27C|nr:hypothetical protein [Streptomyces sp. LBL]
MAKSRNSRAAKGTIVSALAVVVCYCIWTSLLEWSDEVAQADGDSIGAGLPEGLMARVIGLLSLPVLLWVGMRSLRERGNHLLLAAGHVAGWLIGGYLVEQGGVSDTVTALCLALFAGLGGLLSLVEVEPAGLTDLQG